MDLNVTKISKGLKHKTHQKDHPPLPKKKTLYKDPTQDPQKPVTNRYVNH